MFGERWFGEFEPRILVQSQRCRQRIFSGPGIHLVQIRRETQPAQHTQPGVRHDRFRLGLGELFRNLNVQPLRDNSNGAVVAPDHQPDVLGTQRCGPFFQGTRHVGRGLDNQPVRILKCFQRFPWDARIRSLNFGAEARRTWGQAAVV